MAEHGWIPPTKDANERANNLRRFFEVAKLSNPGSLCIPGVALGAQ